MSPGGQTGMSLQAFYKIQIENNHRVIAGIYGSVAIGTAMITRHLVMEHGILDWLVAPPFLLAVYSIWRGAQWYFKTAVYDPIGFWHRAVWLNILTVAWTIYYITRGDVSSYDLIFSFQFIAFTQIAISAALIYVPRAIDVMLASGLIATSTVAVVSKGAFPLEAVIMFATTAIVIRYLLHQHRNVVDDAFHAHQEAVETLAALEDEKSHVHRLAYTDSLTGLNNRRFLMEALQDRARILPEGGMHVILLFDLNRFKMINDTSGHAAGDAALVEVARRLRLALREGEIAARLGGDEFAALFRVSAFEDICARRKEFSEKINGTFHCGCRELTLSAACGYAILDPHETGFGDIIKRADYASYKAKTEGLVEGHLYAPEDSIEQARATLRLHSVEATLRSGDVKSVFQPIVSALGAAATMTTFGYEALSRWPKQGGGFVAPPVAFDIIDQQGKTLDATRLLLGNAALQRRHLPVDTPLFFNFSKGQFRNDLVWKNLEGWLNQFGLDPRALVIEVSENILMADLQQSQDTIKAARDLGIRFALDDFGTGNTGLALLADCRFEFVKIDKAFFSRAKIDAAARVILMNLVRTCNSIGSQVIVEGIETEEDLSMAMSLGASLLQGYYFGKPVEAIANEAVEDNMQFRPNPAELRIVR